MAISFELLARDGMARRGRLTTPHGVVETPAFMPVGTLGTVKGLLPDQVRDAGASMVLANTYHLHLRPGDDRVARLGGLHRFMAWEGSILSDSGGYQVFSLAERRSISDRGVVFRSHVDGRMIDLTPEKAIQIQENLGSDIAMVLDECPPAGCTPAELERAVARTVAWAARCRSAGTRADQAQFAIVQGGLDIELRRQCALDLTALDFPGYALGGFSVGEKPEAMAAALPACADALPSHKPRYLMGVGRPEDLLAAIGSGIDMFDCVLPTRNGRNAQAFTRHGELRLRNACFRDDAKPLDGECDCVACTRFSRAYIHHMFASHEMLGPILLSAHNIRFYQRLVGGARVAIQNGTYEAWSRDWLVGDPQVP
jgi:queuine tRNA-ribosyltransferase